MNICMYSIDAVFSYGTGGVRRFVELLHALTDMGHRVTLYSADSTDVIRAEGLGGAALSDKRKRSRALPGVSKLFFNRETLKKIKRAGYDRVIVFDVRAAFSLAAYNIDNIYLFLRQDMMLYKEIMLKDRHVGRLKRAVFLKGVLFSEALCLSRARKIVVQCKFDLRRLLQRHRLLKKKIIKKAEIQINNINPSWIVESEAAHAGTQVAGPAYDIVFVGNFKDSRKGHDLLLPALERIITSGHKLSVAIIGDGKQLDEYKRRYGNIDGIEFLGRLSDPIPVVSRSRLMVVPSYADSCPNTIMEALYYHVPVIGSNASGIPEILNCKDWLFELNVDSLRGKIEELLEDGRLDELLAAQTKRRDELMFDWGKRVSEIVVRDGKSKG